MLTAMYQLTGARWPPAGTRQKYKNFIFLNSSVRGPFTPHYLPPGWQWTQALTSRLSDTVKVRASRLLHGRQAHLSSARLRTRMCTCVRA
jgi:hypothetical protein